MVAASLQYDRSGNPTGIKYHNTEDSVTLQSSQPLAGVVSNHVSIVLTN